MVTGLEDETINPEMVESVRNEATVIAAGSRRRIWAILALVVVCGALSIMVWRMQIAARRASLAGQLNAAVRGNDLQVVQTLLARGVDPNVVSYTESSIARKPESRVQNMVRKWFGLRSNLEPNPLPLLLAVQGNSEKIALALIQAGADIDIRGADGEPLLTIAVRESDSEVVLRLISKGANVNSLGKTPNANASGTYFGPSLPPLIWALRRGNHDIVDALIKSGAATRCCDDEGRTPLMYAVTMHDLDLVNRFLAREPDFSAKNRFGLTALKIARLQGDSSIVEALERAGETD